MALDGLFLNRILTEIAPALTDSKINRIHQPDKYTVTLKLKSHIRGTCTLVLSAHPQNARIHFTEFNYDNPQKPPLFAMVLRKHIEGGRITEVSQYGLDRVADFTVEARNEVGDLKQCHLLIEIMGKHSNIILCDDTYRILAAVKQYGSSVSRYRKVLPGEDYITPPPSGKANPLLLTEEEFAPLLWQQDNMLPLSKALLKTVDGLSPQTITEIIYRCNFETEPTVDELGEYELHRIWQELQNIIAAETVPTLARVNGIAKDFYYAPLLHYGETTETAADISLLLDSFFGIREQENAFLSRKSNLVQFITQHRNKTAKKVEKQEEELNHAVNGEKYRLYGEILSANLYRVDNYSEKVTLENFYDNNAPIEIPLKKELTAPDNAGYYFKRYNKAKVSRNAIQQHLTANKEELAYLESIAFQAEEALNDDDLAATRSELMHSGYLKERKTVKGKQKNDAPLPPIKTEYMDYTIYIGRNNKQNDRLTLKTAQKDDLWLHTKDIPGSHVIICKKPNTPIPEEVILRAAEYAAYHSKARESSKVPVDYTEVAQVKKPNGARPGMVIYFEQTTILVTPRKEA